MPNMIAYGKEIVSGGRSGSGTTTSWNQIQTTGTKIAEIGIDGIKTDIYAPTGGSGGSSTTWDQIQSTGTKIAEIGIDGVTTDVYAPSGAIYTAGDGIDIDTNNEISVDEMPQSDMSEIVNPLPGTMSRRAKYSTEEQIIGEWIDGKPLYRKVITNISLNPIPSGAAYSSTTVEDITGKTAIMIEAYGRDLSVATGEYMPLNNITLDCTMSVKIRAYNNNLEILTNSAQFAGYKYTVIFTYTKS